MKVTGVRTELHLTMAEEPGDLEDARVVLGLRPRVEADEPGKVPGKTACANCGRSPSGAEMTSVDVVGQAPREHVDPRTLARTVTAPPPPRVYPSPEGLHCTDDGECQAARDRREPAWISRQYPMWQRKYAKVQAARIDWKKTLAARQYAAAQAASGKFFHPDPEYAYAALAREFAPPPDFHRDLIAALAARRGADELELAADEGEGIFGEIYDQPGPAPWAMLPACPDGCEHMTLRCPRTRQHLLGDLRRLPGVTDAAAAVGRRAVLARG